MKQKEGVMEMTKAFQRGDERAFTYFFNEYQPALIYFAFRYLNDRDAADGVVVESFIKIWERHSTFKHHNVIKSWLYSTTKNACINILQEKNRHEGHLTRIAGEAEHWEQCKFIENIIKTEVASQMRLAINELPAECQKVFKCRFIFDMSVRQTAEHLRIAISTVKNQYYLGLDFLKGIVTVNGELKSTTTIRKEVKIVIIKKPPKSVEPPPIPDELIEWAKQIRKANKQIHATETIRNMVVELRKKYSPKKIAIALGLEKKVIWQQMAQYHTITKKLTPVSLQ